MLIIFPKFYLTSPCLFCNYQLVLLSPITLFTPPPTLVTTGLSQFVLCICESVSILFVYFVLYIPRVINIIWYLPFSVCFISFSIIHSASIPAIANNKISFSFLWLSNIPLYIHHCFFKNIDYAITVVPISFLSFIPLLPVPLNSPSSSPPSPHTHTHFMSMGRTYKLFGFSLNLPRTILSVPIQLLVPCTFSPHCSPLPPH